MVLLSWLCLLLLQTAASADITYTVNDDASWAVHGNHLSHQLGDKQALYNHFLDTCQKAVGERRNCTDEDKFRLEMNLYQPMSVKNYTNAGFKKIRAPDDLFLALKEFWEANHHMEQIEWHSINTYHNMWESPPTIIYVEDATLIGGGEPFKQTISDAVQTILEEWSGQRLSPVSLYGIRIYKNNSILAPHVDRFPLITSAIINVDQSVDEDWPLEVYDRHGRALNVSMQPGDMVLYESHSLIHGRPFPLNGRYYANIFVHFEPLGPLDGSLPQREGPDLPPYLLNNSPWEGQWRKDNPHGWKLEEHLPEHDPHDIARKGDLKSLKTLAKKNPAALHLADPNGWRPVHESVRSGHIDSVKFFLENGADINERTNHGEGYSLLRLASMYLGEDHDITQMLASMGAVDEGPEL